MSLTEPRLTYKPFEYPEAHDYFKSHEQSHWTEWVIPMNSTVQDWSEKLSKSDKEIIAGVLLGFTQSEVVIGNYWAQKVSVWFPKPEINEMCNSFAGREGTHGSAYNLLNTTLDLEEHDAFLKDPIAAAKLNNLIERPSYTLKDKALSIAVNSGFGEGVSLYSSFAILLHFATRNLMKGLADIIAYSVVDESKHSEAGCWLYRQLVTENPELYTDTTLAEEVYEAFRVGVQIEKDFVYKKVFNGLRLPAGSHNDDKGLGAEEVNAFIEHRANLKLQDLGLEPIFTPDAELVDSVAGWFYTTTAGLTSTDFFAARVTSYAKGTFNTDRINWDTVFKPYGNALEDTTLPARTI